MSFYKNTSSSSNRVNSFFFGTTQPQQSPTSSSTTSFIGGNQHNKNTWTSPSASSSSSSSSIWMVPPLPLHPEIMRKLDRFIALNKIPHIIFHGASGAGKLTLVKEFLQRIYKGDRQRLKTHVITVNCSHGKGIQFIRDEIKFFAKTNIASKAGTEFKTIVLLNAHHLTVDAQSALRRCIELFSYNTRFFIVVENKNKLLTPILSRFCDIHVPEHMVHSHTVNLHTYVLQYTCPFRRRLQDHQKTTIQTILSDPLPAKFMKSHALYEAGISCLDLMEWFDECMSPSALKYDCWMHFHIIKSEFRCEKLLMLRVLFFFSSFSSK